MKIKVYDPFPRGHETPVKFGVRHDGRAVRDVNVISMNSRGGLSVRKFKSGKRRITF
jgi:hypothetical protein